MSTKWDTPIQPLKPSFSNLFPLLSIAKDCGHTNHETPKTAFVSAPPWGAAKPQLPREIHQKRKNETLKWSIKFTIAMYLHFHGFSKKCTRSARLVCSTLPANPTSTGPAVLQLQGVPIGTLATCAFSPAGHFNPKVLVTGRGTAQCPKASLWRCSPYLSCRMRL